MPQKHKSQHGMLLIASFARLCTDSSSQLLMALHLPGKQKIPSTQLYTNNTCGLNGIWYKIMYLVIARA